MTVGTVTNSVRIHSGNRVFSMKQLSRQSGLTLIEIMISMVVGLILLAGIISIFVNNKQAYRLQESSSVLNENVRYTLNQLEFHLRMGEHWGGMQPTEVEIDPTLAALAISTACGVTSPAIAGIGFVGFDGGATPPIDCIPAADYQPETDVVMIRYAEPARIPSVDVDGSSDIFIRTSLGRRAMVLQGTAIDDLPTDLYDPADPDPTEKGFYRYHTVIYFIRKCASQERGTADVCDAADDTTPTLARLVLTGTALVQEDVMAGVEQLQFAYAVLDESVEPPMLEYRSAADIEAESDWNQLSNVNVAVAIRGDQIDTTYNGSVTRDMHGYEYSVAAADRQYRRKFLNFAVQIRNLTRS